MAVDSYYFLTAKTNLIFFSAKLENMQRMSIRTPREITNEPFFVFF